MTAQQLSSFYGISKGKAKRLLQYSTDINRINQAALEGSIKRVVAGCGFGIQKAIINKIQNR
jgi:hypothetical protein